LDKKNINPLTYEQRSLALHYNDYISNPLFGIRNRSKYLLGLLESQKSETELARTLKLLIELTDTFIGQVKDFDVTGDKIPSWLPDHYESLDKMKDAFKKLVSFDRHGYAHISNEFTVQIHNAGLEKELQDIEGKFHGRINNLVRDMAEIIDWRRIESYVNRASITEKIKR